MIYILTIAISIAAYILFRRIFTYTTVTVLSLTIALTYASCKPEVPTEVAPDSSPSEQYQKQSKPSVLSRSFGTGRIYGSGLDNSNRSDRLTCPVCNQNPHNEHCTYNGKRLSRYR
jgi:hypothetical protein